MGFRGQPFAFDSPAAAVAAMIARIRPPLSPRATEHVPLDRALGRILARDALADRDSPAFDYSAMDGYAIRTAHLAAPAGLHSNQTQAGPAITLPVLAESRISQPPPRALDGYPHPGAVRIATGAPIPPGADAVIRREDATEHAPAPGGQVKSISLTPQVAAGVRPGDYIRRRGENAPAGTVVLRAGEMLSAAALATLAAVGVTQPIVFTRVRAALITTGDELVEPHHAPSAFQIRNCNAPALAAILASHAWAEVTSISHVHDDGDLVGAMGRVCRDADAVVLTGGVSMGHRDPVRAALEQAGAGIVFHGLPQRPGKPMLGAVLQSSAQLPTCPLLIFGLPGNPVSSLVTCVRVVLPVLAACAGARRTPPPCLPRLIELRNPDDRTLDLWWHRPVRLVADTGGPPRAELIDTRGSGDIVSAGMSDGFVEVAPNRQDIFLPYYAWPGANGCSGPLAPSLL